MQKGLIENWNSVVGANDTVYILGDCHHGRGSAELAIKGLIQCNGKKHLIKGNHDSAEFLHLAHQMNIFESVQDYKEIKHNKTRFILFHYPMRSWRGSGGGSIQCYGHTHGTMEGIGRSLDVGIDAQDYKPVSIEEVYQRMMKIDEKVYQHGDK